MGFRNSGRDRRVALANEAMRWLCEVGGTVQFGSATAVGQKPSEIATGDALHITTRVKGHKHETTSFVLPPRDYVGALLEGVELNRRAHLEGEV